MIPVKELAAKMEHATQLQNVKPKEGSMGVAVLLVMVSAAYVSFGSCIFMVHFIYNL